MTKIHVDLAAYPKGTELSLGGILVENGKTRTLTDEEVADFVSRNGETVSQHFKGHKEVTVSGVRQQTSTSEKKQASTPKTEEAETSTKEGDA